MLNLIYSLVRDEEAASMVEYGLLVALIAMVALVGVTTLGVSVNSLFNTVGNSV